MVNLGLQGKLFENVLKLNVTDRNLKSSKQALFKPFTGHVPPLKFINQHLNTCSASSDARISPFSGGGVRESFSQLMLGFPVHESFLCTRICTILAPHVRVDGAAAGGGQQSWAPKN